MKVINISSPETIVVAIGQTLRVRKPLVFDDTSSIRINFYGDLEEVPQKVKLTTLVTYRFTITIPKDS